MKQRVAIPVVRNAELNGGKTPAEWAAFGTACTSVQLVKIHANEHADVHFYDLTFDDAGIGP